LYTLRKNMIIKFQTGI